MALTEEQRRNAATIISVGRSLGASDRDVTIALMTALQESGLRNLSYGDRDSVGLFQQRAPWGSFEERTNPRESARMFFQGGRGGQPGLFSKTNRNEMSLTQAAQAVQVSAFPDAYAKHEKSALELLGTAAGGSSGSPDAVEAPSLEVPSENAVSADMAPEDTGSDVTLQGLLDSSPEPGDYLPKMTQQEFMEVMGTEALPGPFDRPVAPVATSGLRKRILDEGFGYIGTPYVWGGTSRTGVDCSGLVQSVFAKFGIDLPRVSYEQAAAGARIGRQQAQPGDLVAWDNSSRNNGADHIAIYLGDGQILEAPRPGAQVRIRQLDPDEQTWFVDMSKHFGG